MKDINDRRREWAMAIAPVIFSQVGDFLQHDVDDKHCWIDERILTRAYEFADTAVSMEDSVGVPAMAERWVKTDWPRLNGMNATPPRVMEEG